MPAYLDHFSPNLEKLGEVEKDLNFNWKNLVEVYSDKSISKVECYRWAAQCLVGSRNSVITDINEVADAKSWNKVKSVPDVVLQAIGKDFLRFLSGVEKGKMSRGERGLMVDVLSSWAIYKIQSYATISLAKENKFEKISLVTPGNEKNSKIFHINDKLPVLPLSPRDKSFYIIHGGQ